MECGCKVTGWSQGVTADGGALPVDYHIDFCPLHAAAGEMLEVLKSLSHEMDEGRLCRNISADHEPDWAIKQMPLVATLGRMVGVIAKAEGKNDD